LSITALPPQTVPEATEATPVVSKPRSRSRLRRHITDNRRDYLCAALLALLVLGTRAYNLGSYPAWFVDEGVYVSQAWAVVTTGDLAPYTYWYDHPPGGWIQMAGWFALTGALQRYGSESILAGREFMVVCAMASVMLIYALSRRLGMRRSFALMAGALFALSPLAISFNRYVLLDNIVVPWLLGAMVLAMSPTRRLSAALGSAACLAAATLSKETALLAAPAVLLMVWQNYRGSSNRSQAIAILTSATALLAGMYVLYAALKSELLPGPGHVSLWDGQIMFQLAARAGSGSVFDPTSEAWGKISTSWLPLDSWMTWAGVLAMLPALFVRRLRGPALALLVHVAMMFRGGYLPYPFIIPLLPFMALLVAGLLDVLWPRLQALRATPRHNLWLRSLRTLRVTVLIMPLALFVLQGAPAWAGTMHYEATSDATSAQKATVAWVRDNISADAVLVTEGELWLDLRMQPGRTKPDVIWDYKLDSDPDVARDLHGRSIQYLVVNKATLDAGDVKAYPTLLRLATTAQEMARFGEDNSTVVVLKVSDLEHAHPG
jgi:4-amino-4-deoxy-L-arabinose transferase-like glycosyltransferase